MSLQGNLSVERMCQLAQVSRAGFYRSLQEQEPDREELELRAAIQELFLEHRRRYGYRRITKELRRQGMIVNRKRVERLMQSDNLLAVQRRAYVVTTDSKHDFEVYLNLARRLKLTGLNQLWVADITYIRLQKEFVYLAVMLDAYSRKVVGWALDRTLAASLPKAALEMALADRQPGPGLVHHSDRGVQYASAEYQAVLMQHGIVPSMSRPANPYDNASCESFMKTLKQEEIYLNQYRDLEHLRSHVADFIEQYYNRRRLHSSLGYLPPEEFEQTLVPTAGAKLSFFRHAEVYRPDDLNRQTGSNLSITPQTIGVDESPTGYSLVSCSPVSDPWKWVKTIKEPCEIMRGRGSMVSRPAMQWCSDEPVLQCGPGVV
jgi:putative transposase